MRELSTIRKREKLNVVMAVDEPDNGTPNHRYHIVSNKSGSILNVIQFQKGSRSSRGSVEGAIDSDLLEIVRDRLKNFQSGASPSRESAIALTHIEEALMWLNRRLEDRLEKVNLGQSKK